MARRGSRTWSPGPVFRLVKPDPPFTIARPALAEVKVEGRSCLVLKERIKSVRERLSAKKTVRLLPAFDTYLLGYRSRELAVPVPLERRLQRGGGWRHPAVVIDGRAIGAWSLRKGGGRGQVLVEAFESVDGAVRAGIEAEVADIGRFLDLQLMADISRTRLRF